MQWREWGSIYKRSKEKSMPGEGQERDEINWKDEIKWKIGKVQRQGCSHHGKFFANMESIQDEKSWELIPMGEKIRREFLC